MNVVYAAVSASALVGLMVAPGSHLSRPRTAWALAVLCSLGLVVVSVLLVVAGERGLPAYTMVLAVAVLYPAWWLGRCANPPPVAADAGTDPDAEDDSGGGGGGGLRKPPQDPPPSPPSPGLDWDAFDRERETWTIREPGFALRES